MKTRLLLIVTVVAVAAPHGVARSADWTSIKPQTTTEAELRAAFGPPDEVIATFAWSEWSAVWKKRPVTNRYVLRYTAQLSRSALLTGFAGKADAVNVTISDKKVLSVEWTYGGPSARVAAGVVRADTQMNHDRVESGSQSSKQLTSGWLTVDLGPNDSKVRVVLEMK
jgi:hypothetical protein